MRWLLAPAAGLLLAGCALLPRSADNEGRTGSAQVVAAPAAVVWRALPHAYEALGLEVFLADSSALLVASTRAHDLWVPVLGPRQAPYARCALPRVNRTVAAATGGGLGRQGIPLSLPPGRVMLTVETELADQGEATRVQTRMIISPVSMAGSAGGDEPYCVSTGRLETRIAEELRSRVDPPMRDQGART